MDSYFVPTANSNIIQTPVTFEPTKQALNRTTPVIDSFPLGSLNKQGFLVGFVDFNDWLCSVLAYNKLSQFLAAVASITNNVLWAKLTIGKPSLTEDTASHTSVVDRGSGNIGSYGYLVLGICQQMKLVSIIELLLTRCIKFGSPSS